MQTVTQISIGMYEDRGSKFLSTLCPYGLFSETLENLKLEHPKACHFVTAARWLNEHGQINELAKDDGEPSGTSGRPTLMVLAGVELINVALITARYFGGTKLGPGGLVQAYTRGAQAALGAAEVKLYEPVAEFIIEIEAGRVGEFEGELKRQGHRLAVEREFVQGTLWRYKLKGPESEIQALQSFFEF